MPTTARLSWPWRHSRKAVNGACTGKVSSGQRVEYARKICHTLFSVTRSLRDSRHETCFKNRLKDGPDSPGQKLLQSGVDHDECLPLRSLRTARLLRKHGVREMWEHACLLAGPGGHGFAEPRGSGSLALSLAQSGRAALSPL